MIGSGWLCISGDAPGLSGIGALGGGRGLAIGEDDKEGDIACMRGDDCESLRCLLLLAAMAFGTAETRDGNVLDSGGTEWMTEMSVGIGNDRDGLALVSSAEPLVSDGDGLYTAA